MKEEPARLCREIRAILQKAQETDEAEDVEFGKDFRGDELPAELARRESRLRTIEAAKKRLEERQKLEDQEKGRHEDDHNRPAGGRGQSYTRDFGEPEAKAQENFTDPESRIMKTSQGFEQCYNARIAVDGARQIVIAADLDESASDAGKMEGLLDTVKVTLQQKPFVSMGDAGFRSEEAFQQMHKKGFNVLVSLGKEGARATKKIRPELKYTLAMKEKLSKQKWRAIYKKRKTLVEAPFGWIKSVLGFRRFSLRSKQKVKSEWKFVTLCLNLRRMATLAAG